MFIGAAANARPTAQMCLHYCVVWLQTNMKSRLILSSWITLKTTEVTENTETNQHSSVPSVFSVVRSVYHVLFTIYSGAAFLLKNLMSVFIGAAAHMRPTAPMCSHYCAGWLQINLKSRFRLFSWITQKTTEYTETKQHSSVFSVGSMRSPVLFSIYPSAVFL